MKKIIVIALTLVLAITSFTGCGKDGKKDSTTTNNQKQVGDIKENEKKENNQQEEVVDLSLPISTEGLTFSWYTPNRAKKVCTNYDELIGFQELEKRTGIDIEWSHPAGGNNGQDFSIQIASGKYPDFIQHDFASYPGGLAKLHEDGVIIDIAPYLEKYAPNFKKLLDENEELKKQAYLNDGKTIVQFPKIELDRRRLAYTGFAIRQDWLDKLGLEQPKTIDEYEKVLIAFRDEDPNGNGEKDEVPFLAETKLEALYYLAGAWGMAGLTDTMDFYYSEKTGQLEYAPMQPEFKEYLTTLNSWYEQGLIDRDFVSLDVKAVDAKIASNIGGSSLTLTARLAKTNFAAEDENFKFLGMQFPTKETGGTPYNIQSNMGNVVGDGVTISSQCKDIEAAIRLLDYGYSEEGATLLNWGIEGESFKVENGKKVFTDKILSAKSPVAELMNYALTGKGWAKVMDYDAWSGFALSTPEMQAANKIWYEASPILVLPRLNYTPEESEIVSEKATEIYTYFKEMYVKFIMGIEPMSEYDKFISTLKDLGVDEVVEAARAAHQRHLNKFN